MVIGLPAKQLSLRLVGSSPTLSENKSSGEFYLSAWLSPTMSQTPAERGGVPLSGGSAERDSSPKECDTTTDHKGTPTQSEFISNKVE